MFSLCLIFFFYKLFQQYWLNYYFLSQSSRNVEKLQNLNCHLLGFNTNSATALPFHRAITARLCMTPSGVITWRRFCSLISLIVFGGKGLRVIVWKQKTCSFLFKYLAGISYKWSCRNNWICLFFLSLYAESRLHSTGLLHLQQPAENIHSTVSV